MNQLTHKELLLLQDNIRMNQETAQFLEMSARMATDPQLKGLCQSMIQDHQQNAQILSSYITQSAMQ